MTPDNGRDATSSESYVEIIRELEIPLKIPMIVLGCAAILGIIAGYRSGNWPFGSIGLVIFLLWWLLNVYPSRRYRIAWDHSRIYMREGGFERSGYFSIPFDEIKIIETGYDGNAGAKANFYPFDYIELFSKYPDQKPVVIRPASLNENQVKSMLIYIW